MTMKNVSDYPDALIWKSKSTAISVRLSEYPAGSKQYGIDVRNYISKPNYQGFTKKGIWIPVESKSGEPIAFKVAIAFIEQLAECIEETPRMLANAIADSYLEQVRLDDSQNKV